MSDEGVCKTASATPGLFISIYLFLPVYQDQLHSGRTGTTWPVLQYQEQECQSSSVMVTDSEAVDNSYTVLDLECTSW